MAPELVHHGGRVHSNKIDVFALGLLMYELVPRSVYVRVFANQLSREHGVLPCPLPELPRGFKDVRQLVDRCMHERPSARPSAASVAAELHLLAPRYSNTRETQTSCVVCLDNPPTVTLSCGCPIVL